MSVIVKEQEKLLKVIEGLLQTGSYSDLTITTRGKDHRVHQAIVCPQSEVVAKACRFQLQIKDDSSDTPRSPAIVDFKEEDGDVVGCMVQFLYRSDYDIEMVGEGGDRLRSETSEGHLILHAKVYALAEKYVIEGLKALSLAKFETACRLDHFTPEAFFSAAEFVYASTIEADRGMRDAIVKAFYQHPEYLDSDKVRTTLQTVHGLSYDVLQYIRAKATTGLGTSGWPTWV